MYPYDPCSVARLWSKVDVKKGADSCWEWQGSIRPDGYGAIKIRGTSTRAHRVAWELMYGQPLGDRLALHSCDNKKCCNPMHIYAGDKSQNLHDMYDAPLREKLKAQFPAAGAKLPYWSVFLIRRAMLSGWTDAEIMDATGISSATVSRIRTNKTARDLWPEQHDDNNFAAAVRRCQMSKTKRQAEKRKAA